jgi:DNA-binding transcriptional regulator GbsR (MarR family)
MDAEQIVARTRLSVGNVSMTLQDLLNWGVVKRVPGVATKKRLYTAETDMWAMVARVFRERELRLVERSILQLEEAVALLDGEGKGHDTQSILKSRFLVTRVRNLLDLARVGRRLVERLANTGTADLSGIRDVLRMRRA